MQARCLSTAKPLAVLARQEFRVWKPVLDHIRTKAKWTPCGSVRLADCNEVLHGKKLPASPLQSSREYCGVSRYLQKNFHAQNVAASEAIKIREHREEGFSFQSFEDQLYEVLSNKNGKVPISRMVAGLKSVGLQEKDKRLAEFMLRLKQVQKVAMELETGPEVLLDRDSFKECIKDNIELIRRAFTGDFVIPEFMNFCQQIDTMYWDCRTITEGKVATYIPQLSRYSPDLWGVSLCTVDGQRHNIGDVKIPFSLQSCGKPVTYALALNELGADSIHQYVGLEPSGETFNRLKLNDHNKPHNPLINAGAIVIASLIKSNWKLADRFDYVSSQYRRITGGEYLGFNNAIFLSERETADRNYALGYYMKENKCFPDGINLMEIMDFYFQLCSIEVTCESGSIIAATLANGGICPITGEQIFNPTAVRDTLSLMHSCGMYDYSGQFAFKVGLPAKSGVSGGILLVIPNVMGMCLWSPPLDRLGNSVRGLQFCSDLVQKFAFHHYDNLKHTTRKIDPRKRHVDSQGEQLVSLLFSASNGDLSALRRMVLLGVDMKQSDYDGRTALHLAAAEGHLHCVRFLLEKCEVPCSPKDRWQHTPYDDAVRFNHEATAQCLKEHKEMTQNSQGSSTESQRDDTQTTN